MKVPPETIVSYLPHLTLAQVFDALSYYQDHPQEIDAYIERNQIPDEPIAPSETHRTIHPSAAAFKKAEGLSSVREKRLWQTASR